MTVLQLELTNAQAFINSFNPRAEKHGEERRPAGDIGITVTTNSDILAHFAPDLRAMMFNDNGPRDLADGVPARFPKVKALHWDDEMQGATFQIHHGVQSEPIEFAEATINKFAIEAIDGGTVKLSFRVQVHPDEKQAGKLAGLIQQEVEVSLEPGELPEIGGGEK